MIQTIQRLITLLLILLFPGILYAGQNHPQPLTVTDSMGRAYSFDHAPKRVVSLVPDISEILFAIGAGNSLVGITRHTTPPASSRQPAIVGGFRSPSIEKIDKLNPDLIITADIQHEVHSYFQGKRPLLTLKATGIDSAMERIRLLGRIFGHEKEAQRIIADNRRKLDLIAKKTAKIPPAKRQRVVRLMGRSRLAVPGDDSFQNDFIRAAGGIPPTFHKNGQVVTIDTAQWQKFNPQVIYGCGEGRPEILDTEGVKGVEAVRKGRYLSFPCIYTCRAGIHIGDFVSTLSARIYSKEFSDPSRQVAPNHVLNEKNVDVQLPYVHRARVVNEDIFDFTNRTLLVDFTAPQTILSSLDGWRKNITTVGNHYFPPPSWGLAPGLNDLRRLSFATLKLSQKHTSLLFTGADMNNLAISRKDFKKMTIYALVTAGVRSNAVRMSRDTGNYYEPGTINILLLTNMHLSHRAMTRAIISATEGKTAALEDLDIRSTYSPDLAATGTGTDNILVVQGEGLPIDNAGGHSKMGELIAKAVHDGVTEAIAKQNSILPTRSLFARLDERHIRLYSILAQGEGKCIGLDKQSLFVSMENLLLNPYYAGYITSALAISDANQRGLAPDLQAFATWGKAVSRSISGTGDIKETYHLAQGRLPKVLTMAFQSMVNGLCTPHTSSSKS